jgi:hypothetical protein
VPVTLIVVVEPTAGAVPEKVVPLSVHVVAGELVTVHEAPESEVERDPVTVWPWRTCDWLRLVVTIAGLTVMLVAIGMLAICFAVTRIWNEYVPVPVGVPLMTPVEASRDKPGGNEPDVIDQEPVPDIDDE